MKHIKTFIKFAINMVKTVKKLQQGKYEKYLIHFFLIL